MNKQQRDDIQRLRSSGRSYAQISLAVGLPVGSIKAFCSRSAIKPVSAHKEGVCDFCGATLQIIPKRKPRRFCSDVCRHAWWRDKRENKGDMHTCDCCGKEYASYDEKSRFCSHSCYISDRFRKDGDCLDSRVV